MTRRALILIIIVCSIAAYYLGRFNGLTEKRSFIMGQVERAFEQSFKSGKPFVFEPTKIRLVSKDERNYKIVYRVHQFVWPEDEEILPTPVNKFGQYGTGRKP